MSDTVAPKVVVYTDGACKGNPGPGGWGVWMVSGQHEKEMWGGEHGTTNNRMELTAVIQALTVLKKPCEVVVYTDSEYVRKGITEPWLEDRRQQAREERRVVAGTGGCGLTPQGGLALGEGTRGRSGQ